MDTSAVTSTIITLMTMKVLTRFTTVFKFLLSILVLVFLWLRISKWLLHYRACSAYLGHHRYDDSYSLRSRNSSWRVGGLSIVEARKLEHPYPHALKVKYRAGNPSANHPKFMFQLSGVHYK